MAKKVGNNVGKKKDPRYVKGKYPFTVLDTKTGKLYVRKSSTVNKFITDEKTGEEKFVRQHQVWRLCYPPTAVNTESLEKEIEAEISFAKTGRAKPLSLFEDIA